MVLRKVKKIRILKKYQPEKLKEKDVTETVVTTDKEPAVNYRENLSWKYKWYRVIMIHKDGRYGELLLLHSSILRRRSGVVTWKRRRTNRRYTFDETKVKVIGNRPYIFYREDVANPIDFELLVESRVIETRDGNEKTMEVEYARPVCDTRIFEDAYRMKVLHEFLSSSDTNKLMLMLLLASVALNLISLIW